MHSYLDSLIKIKKGAGRKKDKKRGENVGKRGGRGFENAMLTKNVQVISAKAHSDQAG